MNKQYLFLDVILGNFLIKKGFKKTHKIKENNDTLLESLRKSIAETYLNFVFPSVVVNKFKGYDLKFNSEFWKHLRASFKRPTPLESKNFIFSYKGEVSIPVSEYIQDDNVDVFLSQDRSLSSSMSNFVVSYKRNSSWWYGSSNNYTKIKYSAITKEYFPFAQSILLDNIMLNISLCGTDEVNTPNDRNRAIKKLNPKGYAKSIRIPNLDSYSEYPFIDFKTIEELVSEHFSRTLNDSPTDVEIAKETLKASFFRSLYLFAQNAMHLHRTSISTFEERMFVASGSVGLHSTTLEIGIDVSGFDLPFMDDILKLLKSYINYSFIKYISNGRVDLHNSEILGLSISCVLSDYTDKLINEIITKFELEEGFAPIFEDLHFVLYSFTRPDDYVFSTTKPFSSTNSVSAMSEFRYNFDTSSFETPPVGIGMTKTHGSYGTLNIENVIKWTYIGTGILRENDTDVVILNSERMYEEFSYSKFINEFLKICE